MFIANSLSKPISGGKSVVHNPLATHLQTPISDGKTIPNPKGTDVVVTNATTIKTDKEAAETMLLTRSTTFPTGSILSVDIRWFNVTSGGTDRQVILGINGNNGCFILQNGVPRYRGNGTDDMDFSDLALTVNVHYNLKFERTTADTVVCTRTNLQTNAVDTQSIVANVSTAIGSGAITNAGYGLDNQDFIRIGVSSTLTSRFNLSNYRLKTNIGDSRWTMQEGAGTTIYDISGNGNHITKHADIEWEAMPYRTSLNLLNGFTVDSSAKVPALDVKTKQALYMDGSSRGDFNHSIDPTSDFSVYLDLEVMETVSGNQNLFGIKGNTGSDYGIWMRHDGSKFFIKAGNHAALNFPSDTIVQGDKYQFTISYTASTQSIVATQVKNGASSTPISSTALDNPIDFTTSSTEGRIAANHTTSAYGNFLYKEFKLTQGTTDNVHFDFQTDINSTTVQDLTANNNDLTLTGATMATAWGRRYEDDNGIYVSALYATNATTITNPRGLVHNGAEASLTLPISGTLTYSELTSSTFTVTGGEGGVNAVFTKKTDGSGNKYYDNADTTRQFVVASDSGQWQWVYQDSSDGDPLLEQTSATFGTEAEARAAEPWEVTWGGALASIVFPPARLFVRKGASDLILDIIETTTVPTGATLEEIKRYVGH